MSQSTGKISILLFAIAFLALGLQNTSATPLGKFRLTCPTVTGECDSIAYDEDHTCKKDDDCETGLSPTIGCCHVPCNKTEKYCVRLIKRSSICAKSKGKNIVFLVDGTVNYNQDFVEAAKDFQAIKNFVREIVIGLSSSKFGISIMQFGGPHDARTEISVSRGSDTDVLEKALISMKQMEGSERKIGEALAAASNKLYEMETLSYINGVNEELIPGVVVLITRGKAWNIQETPEEIRMMKLKKIHAVTVEVGPHTDGIRRELNKLTCTSSDVFSARYNELPQRVDDVLRTICSGLRICAAEPLSCENKKYDIYIAVDGSRSITERVFKKEKKLIRDLLVLLMSARSSDFSIGLMQFSEKSKTTEILPLGKNSLSLLQAVVEQMEFQSGKRTMLGDALMRIHRQVFNGSGKDRSDAENKVMLFSDGVAHDFPTAKNEAEKLKKQGVEVITVFVGGHRPQLSNIASKFEQSLDMKLNSLAQSAEYADKIESMICRSE